MTDVNPLLDLPFEIPFDRIRAEHVEPAVDALIADARAAIDRIAEGERTYAGTLGAFEAATGRLERAIVVVGHLEAVATTPALRAAYNAAQPKVSAFFSELVMHDGLYAALREFAETPEAAALVPTRKRFLEKTLDDFKRHGAELPRDKKKELEALEVELAKTTTKFSQNVLDATNAWDLVITDEAQLAGLPESAKAAARQSARQKGTEGWRFTLQAPSLIPLLTYLDDAAIREQVWRAYNTRATSGELDNRPLITKILSLRSRRAALLGFDDFADLVLEDRMAKSGAQAEAFVDDLRKKTEPAFRRENEALVAFRRELEGPDAAPLKAWDIGYYAEKLRQKLYDFDEEEVRPYFSVEKVLDGLFRIVQQLYGVTIRPHEAAAWNEDVRSYAIEEGGKVLAAFYVDLFPRENKRGGAWMNALITGVDPDGARVSPHLGLFCANVNPPVDGAPALLTHREVETLFHEFGHLLHHALSEVPVRSLSGTNVAWDFVELPSQIMENWCWEREALDLFARHYETGETIPEALFEKMMRARTYRAANAQMRQLGFAAVDLALHRHFEIGEDGKNQHGEEVLTVARRVAEAHSPVAYPESYGMIAGFSHLFASPVGYAAGYYSYKWAEVLDADAFTRFQKEGITSQEVGRAFRTNILACGDSRDPADLYRAFMGRDPELEPLLARQGLLAPA